MQTYAQFPIIQTLSGQLTLSHYVEILKADNEFNEFYIDKLIEKWGIWETQRQMRSMLFYRLAFNTRNERLTKLTNKDYEVQQGIQKLKHPLPHPFPSPPNQTAVDLFQSALSTPLLSAYTAYTDNLNLVIRNLNLLNFKGNVYVLINGLSFSVTTGFCAIVQSNHKAVFIGEETGGAYYVNTSGRFIDVSLPYSSITIHIPTVKYSMSVNYRKNKDKGIIPDYQVIATMNDLVEKRIPFLILHLN